jgi:hypothetical protein
VKSLVATPIPSGPRSRPSIEMNVADDLPLVIFTSTTVKQTIERAASVVPAPPC